MLPADATCLQEAVECQMACRKRRVIPMALDSFRKGHVVHQPAGQDPEAAILAIRSTIARTSSMPRCGSLRSSCL